jgi:hypothetical protein
MSIAPIGGGGADPSSDSLRWGRKGEARVEYGSNIIIIIIILLIQIFQFI